MAQAYAFVARQRELGRLRAFLDRALAGEGQICFITGEAGSGKTTLAKEFARQAQSAHADLVVAVGQCDAQTGQGTAFLPFREILELLTGNVDSKQAQGAITPENANRLRSLLQTSGEALLELAPDIVGLLVPWAGLLMRLGTFAAEKGGLADKIQHWTKRRQEQPESRGGIDQGQIFEQCINVLGALAKARPLILALDDLQWADASSIELLFRLGRRLSGQRILMVGTYRPEEVALGRAGDRHPLEKVLAEFKRYYGDICIDLDTAALDEGKHFVDALLDAEPNRLGPPFRQALLRHTGGNPLFTVELLRTMQERGDIVRDQDSRWVETEGLDWTTLPSRVEGVIEERLGRLGAELYDTLTVASVEGKAFTAEVVAQVRGMEARDLVRRLSGELERQHRLVVSEGLERVGSSRLSRYSFLHDLFHSYLYAALSESEKAYLHEDVGNILEQLYGEQAERIAVLLARHFAIADVPEKARLYLRQAGAQAAAQFANQEALDYLGRALDLTPPNDLAERFEILALREQVHDRKGAREDQLLDLAVMDEIAKAMADTGRRTLVALRRALYAEETSDYPAAVSAAQQVVELSQSSGDVESEARGRLQWGRALWHQGQYQEARPLLDAALGMAQEAHLRSVETDALSNLGIVAWYQGDLAEGKARFEQALRLLQEGGDQHSEGHLLNNLACVSYEAGQHGEAMAYQEEALTIYRRTGYRRGEAMALSNLGVYLAEHGQYAPAAACQGDALAIYRDIQDREGEAAALINLGIVSLYQGDFDNARLSLDQALAITRETGDLLGQTEALVYLALLLHQAGNNAEAAQQANLALALARQTGDRRNESHALTHLGHALGALGRLPEAAAAYHEALELRHGVGEQHRAMETLAGLAEAALAGSEPDEALAYAESILAFLHDNTLDSTDEPIRVHLACYRVLAAHGDARAGAVLAAGHEFLQARAATIDHALRRSYLENVPANRALHVAWQQQSAGR
jgi:adenylate cyclase